MEKGGRVLAIILVLAAIAGLLVVAFVPAYRTTLLSMVRGTPEKSPIWQSNTGYYTEVGLTARRGVAHESE